VVTDIQSFVTDIQPNETEAKFIGYLGVIGLCSSQICLFVVFLALQPIVVVFSQPGSGL
jgi:hypothetical protein